LLLNEFTLLAAFSREIFILSSISMILFINIIKSLMLGFHFADVTGNNLDSANTEKL